MTDTLIKVENISKKFCRDLKKSLWYGVKDISGEITGRGKQDGELRSEEFWSVDNVTFELKRGECLGLIGPNGAGKSTLLKMLNGLIKPDKGKITIRGRVGALIELGAGFNPILTGRENIYVNGAILGLSKGEIDKKLYDIIEFAEMDDFIDSPIQNYSSGMKVRLGFAIAAQMDPDVLLIDEVLAVGDIGFRARCFNAINKMQKKAAVIFVSHSMPDVNRICSDICVFNKGQALFQGKDVPKGIDRYYSSFPAAREMTTGSGRALIHSISLESKDKRDVESINYLDDLTVCIETTIDSTVNHPCIGITFMNQALQIIAQSHSHFNHFQVTNSGNKMQVSVNLGQINLSPGIYNLTIGIFADNVGEVLLRRINCKSIKIMGSFFGQSPIQINGDWSVTEID